MLITKNKRLIILTLVSVLCSCAADVANRYYLDHALPAKSVEQVEILNSAPKEEYEVIADFQSRGDSESSLTKKAAEIGADAIIISHIGGFHSSSEEWVKTDSSAGGGGRIVGTAIRFINKK